MSLLTASRTIRRKLAVLTKKPPRVITRLTGRHLRTLSIRTCPQRSSLNGCQCGLLVPPAAVLRAGAEQIHGYGPVGSVGSVGFLGPVSLVGSVSSLAPAGSVDKAG